MRTQLIELGLGLSGALNISDAMDALMMLALAGAGDAQAERYILTLREVLKQDVDARAVCRQIQGMMEHSKRLLLLQYMYGIAQADGDVDPREVEVIRQIAGWLGISAKDVKSIEASYYTDVASHYAVLEIPETATDSEVKKAFRRMAVKFHPDKVRDMGADYQKQARERFDRRGQRVDEALVVGSEHGEQLTEHLDNVV